MTDPVDDYGQLLTSAERALDEVEAALSRLDDGTYGVCEACGGAIDEARLASLPTVRSCGGHPQLGDPHRPPGPEQGLTQSGG